MEAEKMKIVAVGALTVCVLGVGAFQFLAPAEAPKAAVAAKEDKAAAPKARTIPNPALAGGLAVRDPFAPAAFIREAETAAKAPVAPPAVPAGGAVPPPSIPPAGLVGSLPAPGGAAAIPMSPGEVPAPAEPRFAYRLTGVIVGARSAAIFDDGGRQRLVTVGSSIGEDATLVSVSAGRATVRFAGKLLRLRPQAAPSAAARPAEPAPKAPVAPISAPPAPGGFSSLMPSGATPDGETLREALKNLQGNPPQ